MLRRRRAALALVGGLAALAAGACGSGGDGADGDGGGPSTVTGRVVSRTAERYCVSPDRGDTRTCVDVPDPATGDVDLEGVEVGTCVETSPDLRAEGARVRVVAESACAAGDLGEAGN